MIEAGVDKLDYVSQELLDCTNMTDSESVNACVRAAQNHPANVAA
jgi:hypothetical protein